VLVGYAEALGEAKAAAVEGGGDIDPNQELVADGPANILSGLLGGFLVVGNLSKPSVAMAAGVRSQFAKLVAAVFCSLTLVFLTPLFCGMPQPALAAIVIAAMLHLSKPRYLRNLATRSGPEFAVAAIVVADELTMGVLQEIAVAVDVDLCDQPPAGRGLLIWRAGGDLFFASIGHFDEAFKAALAASRPPVKRVLLDADSVDFMDASACAALLNTIKELQSRGITFAFARVRDDVRERMRIGGIETVVGPANFYERATDGVRAWQEQTSSIPSPRDRAADPRHPVRMQPPATV
jgi:sulfate permease, SulP family